MPDNCNLTADRVTKVLTGTAGKDTTVQINNLDGGNALFVTISYDGNEIAAGKASATFTIKAGDKKLSYVYEGSSAGDQITITDPCDTILDAFPCDPGNFRIDRTVVGLAVQVTGGDLTVKAGE
jgi:hypothetical protein